MARLERSFGSQAVETRVREVLTATGHAKGCLGHATARPGTIRRISYEEALPLPMPCITKVLAKGYEDERGLPLHPTRLFGQPSGLSTIGQTAYAVVFVRGCLQDGLFGIGIRPKGHMGCLESQSCTGRCTIESI